MNDENNTPPTPSLLPEVGQPFTFGGKTFELQFLTCEGEGRLIELLMPRVKSLALAGKTDYKYVLETITELLPELVGIILKDYDPSIEDAWVRSVRAARVRLAMYDIVSAQFALNDIAQLLVTLSHVGAALPASAEA